MSMILSRCDEPNLIQREAKELSKSKQDCYAATSAKFHRQRVGGDLQAPIHDLEAIAQGASRPSWPSDAPFAVCLTHDVDNVSWHDPWMHSRRILAQFRHLAACRFERRAFGALKSTAGSIMASSFKRQHEPLHCYERWLELESEFDAKSTFFFLPECYDRPHYSDGGYRYSDFIRFEGKRCTVAEMISQIHQRGWEVGLHPSWYSYCSLEAIRRDKQRLEAIIKAPVVSARQHFLHFDIRHTPKVYQQAGLQYDSSLGFNDDIGFRSGTSWPFRLVEEASSDLRNVYELPLVIQDKCLTKLRGEGDEKQAIELGLAMAEQVRQVGGVLTLLWHPRLITDKLSMDVYRGLLARLRDQGAWLTSIKEVGDWWTREQN